MSKLLVYSASAGSGKTHQITGHYILMLFSKNKAYRNILAVTFTNKASEEMKSRIVSDLAQILYGENNDRINEIKEYTKLSTPMIKHRVQQIFKEILHDYSFLSISTIDSFFQKILRSFTRETGIQYNYEIELDTGKVINIAVDKMLELSETDKELKNNIIALVEQNIENSAKWDFRRNLKDFLKKVIESDFRSYEEEYNNFFFDKSRVIDFKKKLDAIELSFLNTVKNYLNDISEILLNNNLSVEHFSGGASRSILKRILSTYDKITAENKYFDVSDHFKNFELPEKWLKKEDLNKEPLKSITDILICRCGAIREHFIRDYKYYITSRIVKKHFNYAALINQSLKVIHEYLTESGKFLISEVPVFLSEIANLNSSSFIYEKTGSFYENYLIDEFQDTSRIQWDSFYPLLSESLSHGDENNTNILVGDVKQSIYSWRGGDWQLLAEKVGKQFENFYENVSLVENWRSGKEIVEFNNVFFRLASGFLKNAINDSVPEEFHGITGNLVTEKIYNNIAQTCKRDIQSVVKISIFNITRGEESSFKKNSILKMIFQIEELQEKGYQPGDIMILVRKNDEGTLIAEEIINYAQSGSAKKNVIYDVISSEALSISSNKAIQLIISCFKFLVDERDILSFTEAAYIYYLQNRIINKETVIFNREDFIANLEIKINPLKGAFRQKLLHDITDTIIKELELNVLADNVPFLNSFRDLIHDYEMRYPSEIQGFLEYWDDAGVKQNLKIPEKQNAINIITVHKAKGLAADFIFVPFCNWDLYRANDTIWASCRDLDPFNALPVWAVNFNNKLSDSFFAKDFYVHKFKQTVESFNMMYVAFTRARKGLYISAADNLDGNINTVEKVLCNIINNSELISNLDFKLKEDNNLSLSEYSLGEISSIAKQYYSSGYLDKYPVFIPEKQIKIKSFFDRDKVDVDSKSKVHKGIVYHKIFEKIKTVNDINEAVDSLYYQGMIHFEDIEDYKSEVSNILAHPFVNSWFNDAYSVSNEIEIISKDGIVRRPDRVMENGSEIIIVDYKFGLLENKKYIRQAIEYSLLLSEMGYNDVKSYIWYVMSGYVVNVDKSSNKHEKIYIN